MCKVICFTDLRLPQLGVHGVREIQQCPGFQLPPSVLEAVASTVSPDAAISSELFLKSRTFSEGHEQKNVPVQDM